MTTGKNTDEPRGLLRGFFFNMPWIWAEFRNFKKKVFLLLQNRKVDISFAEDYDKEIEGIADKYSSDDPRIKNINNGRLEKNGPDLVGAVLI